MGSDDKLFTTPRMKYSGGGSINDKDDFLMPLKYSLVVGFIARHLTIMYNML